MNASSGQSRGSGLRARGAGVLACVAIVAAGCAAPESGPLGTGTIDATAGPLANAGGLRLREWRVADRPGGLESALGRHAVGLAVAPDVGERLARNGLRLTKVSEEAIDALLADLGGATVDRDGWHGQAFEWRELAGTAIDPAGNAFALDGAVRRLEGGRLRLLMRGWTMPMEDGPRLYVELVPVHDRGRPSRLDQILGNTGFRGERFDGLAASFEMEPGYAYVLSSADPGADALDGGVGPVTLAPTTVGETLLRPPATPPVCDVLVLIPALPGSLAMEDPSG